MSIATFILSRMGPAATVGAAAASAQAVGKKLDAQPIGTAIQIVAKTVENFVAALFLTIGAYWLAPFTPLPLVTLILGHLLVFTPSLLALTNHLAKKWSHDELAEKTVAFDSFLQRCTKCLNTAIYLVVATLGTCATYRWMVSQVTK